MKYADKLLLYAVTDRSWLGGKTLYEEVEYAIQGGVTFVQLREKRLEETAFLKEAQEIQKLCKKYHVEIAARIHADGVHIGQSDMEVKKARERLGNERIIGVSAQTVEQAVRAERDGADYLGVGAVFPTGSKADAVEVDHQTLREICRAVQIPVIAIGGITKDNVKELNDSGICGIAVISAIFAEKDTKEAARSLKEKTMEALGII